MLSIHSIEKYIYSSTVLFYYLILLLHYISERNVVFFTAVVTLQIQILQTKHDKLIKSEALL